MKGTAKLPLAFLCCFVFILTACGTDASLVDDVSSYSKSEIENVGPEVIDEEIPNQTDIQLTNEEASSEDSFSQNLDQAAAPPKDQSNTSPGFTAVYSFLAFLSKQKGTIDRGAYSYQFATDSNGDYILSTDSNNESLTLIRAGYNLKYKSLFSIVIPHDATNLYEFAFQEYEYDDGNNTPVATASALINPILYQGVSDISVNRDTFYATNYKDVEIETEAMAENALSLLYVIEKYCLYPNGYSIEQIGFSKMRQALDEVNPKELFIEETGEGDTSILDVDSFVNVEVDGEEKKFYVGRSTEGTRGGFRYYTYTIPNINSEKLSFVLDRGILIEGEVWEKDARKTYGDNRFQVYYSVEGTRTRTTFDGDWELKLEKISSDYKHMEGSFYAVVTLDDGESPVELNGYFCFDFGDTLPEAEEINKAERRDNSTDLVDDKIIWTEDDSIKDEDTYRITRDNTGDGFIPCYMCYGSGNCWSCDGKGEVKVNGKWIDCYVCYNGHCPRCGGTKREPFP